MLKWGCSLIVGASLCTLLGCSFENPSELLEGTYLLKNAVFVNQGKITELTCSGEFFVVLKKESDSIRVQPVGSASCPAANPGSFVEVLGGDCEQGVVELMRSSDVARYSHSGADWSCASQSSAQLEMVVGALKEKAILVTRRNLRLPALVTEFVFVRTDDVL